MERNVKCLLLNIDNVLISEVIEIDAQLGDPNCKLTNPCRWKKNESTEEFYFERWIEASDQKELMIRSEDILTIADPTPEVIKRYFEFIE
jgi:hypothetical protein